MISIPNTTGVYILVFYLSQATKINFNRKGSQHSFLPGWYHYVGKCVWCGWTQWAAGRHQRRIADGKLMYWNVDYFREHALL